MPQEHKDCVKDIAELSASLSSAHKRLDSHHRAITNTSDLVSTNMQMCLPAVDKANEAYKAVQVVSKELGELISAVKALHKRNDQKDKDDAIFKNKIDKHLEEYNQKLIVDAINEGESKMAGKVFNALWSVGAIAFISFCVWLVTHITDTEKKLETHIAFSKSKKEDQ